MAASEIYSMSAVTVGSSELSIVSGTTSLQNKTDVGWFELVIAKNTNVAKGDEFLVQVKDKAISGGTQDVLWSATIRDGMSEAFCFPGRILLWGWDMTMKKIAGTDRAFTASIRKAG